MMVKEFLEKSALKAETALNRYGIRALETGTVASMLTSYVSVSLMLATLFSGLMNPAILPALCLGSLAAGAAMGIAKCGAEKWTWDRATAREREADALARGSFRDVEVSRPLRGQPLGPAFSAAAQPPEEAPLAVLSPDIKAARRRRSGSGRTNRPGL